MAKFQYQLENSPKWCDKNESTRFVMEMVFILVFCTLFRIYLPPKNYSQLVCVCVVFSSPSASLVCLYRCVLLFAVASCAPFMPIIRIFYCRHHKHTTANNMLNIYIYIQSIYVSTLLFSFFFVGCYCGLLCCWRFSSFRRSTPFGVRPISSWFWSHLVFFKWITLKHKALKWNTEEKNRFFCTMVGERERI